MKIIKLILCLGAFAYLLLPSCESDNDTIINEYKYRMKFSDGLEITENEIFFYDSTTHFLFLKNNLDLNQEASGFSVFVNNDVIYSGIFYSCILSTPPPETFFISDCLLYGQNVIDIGYYPYSIDLRNDPKIINALEESGLLQSGLTCEIDSIHVNSLENSSEVICKITITNQDMIPYYILHPNSMGELNFNCYTGGLSFQNIDTKSGSFFRWSVLNPDYANLTMDDFLLLPEKSEVSFTFKSSDYHKMVKGYYNATFRFCGLKYNVAQFELIQHNGHIWLGTSISEFDSLKVE